jgi:MFS superfamily sulfate permease-like transporter
MWIVTGRAIFLSDRPVPVIILVQPFLHVHDLSRRRFELLVVAGKTEIRRRRPQLFGKVGVVGIMTIQTFFLDFVGVVLGFRISNVSLLLRMATETERRHGIIQPQSVGRRCVDRDSSTVERREEGSRISWTKLLLFPYGR